jgi:hypothetical protein
VNHILKSKDDLSAILIDVRNDVISETNGQQVPWEHSALRGRFYFATSTTGKVAPSPPVDAAARLGNRRTVEEINAECSKRATDRSLHGKERWDFRAQCKQTLAAEP